MSAYGFESRPRKVKPVQNALLTNTKAFSTAIRILRIDGHDRPGRPAPEDSTPSLGLSRLRRWRIGAFKRVGDDMDTRAFGYIRHHEAGHAFVRWFIGIDTDFVEVLPRGSTAIRHDEDRTYRFKARISGHRISYPNSPAELAMMGHHESIRSMIGSGPLRAEMALLVIVAGVVAEARQRRKSEVAVWCAEGTSSDLAQAETVVRLWLPGEPDPIEDACVRVRALLRQPAAVEAVAAIAEALKRTPRLSGVEVAALCGSAFGGRPPPGTLPAAVARFEGALSPDGLELCGTACAACDRLPMPVAA